MANKSVPRNHLSDAHKWTTTHVLQKQLSICTHTVVITIFKLQLHDTIYRLRFYSNSLTHILSLSNSRNDVASIQKNRGDKSRRVIVALGYNYTVRFIAPILLY